MTFEVETEVATEDTVVARYDVIGYAGPYKFATDGSALYAFRDNKLAEILPLRDLIKNWLPALRAGEGSRALVQALEDLDKTAQEDGG